MRLIPAVFRTLSAVALLLLIQSGTLLMGQTCPCTIWPSTTVPATTDLNQTQPVELGVKFTSSSNGYISGVRFYKGANNTGTHVGNLWSSTGTLLARATFAGETATGWQQVNFSTPVAITANTVYVASYFSPTGDFAINRPYFANAGVSNPPLQALVNGGAGGANGVYTYGSTSQFPTSSYQSSNYWVDVVFSTALTVATTSPLPAGVQGAAYSQTLTAGGGTAPYSWVLASGSTLPVGLALSTGGVISGTPTSAGTTSFTVQVTDSSSPVQNAQATLSITIAAMACPCTIWPNTATPGTPDTNETLPLELGVRFTASVSGSISGIRFYKGVNNTGTHIGHLWSNTGTLLATATFTGETASGWQQVNFSSPVAISANTVYVASYFSPTGDFPVNRSYFATTGVSNPPLTAAIDGGSGAANGVYSYGSTSQFPASSYQSSNYWVDVVFSSSSGTSSLTITTKSPLPSGTQGTAYSTTLAATGGTTPYTWSLTSGTLPSGLALNASTGAITGTPTVTVTNTPLTFQVKDSGSPQQSQSISVTLTIAPSTLVITTTSLPSGQVNTAYSTALAATGGTTPFTWSLTSGTLPAGLALNASTGAITGTPTVAVTNTPLTFQVKDSGSPQQTQSANLTLTIAPATLTVTTTSLPSGTLSTAYNQTLAASGGTTPLSWTLASGSLPAGLSLSTAGVISGTPTATGTASFTVQVTDSGSPVQNAQASLSITISAYSCPCTIWPGTATPAKSDTNETLPLELGVRFTATVNGYISGIRFYKGVNNTGTHIGHLWSSTGTLLATATFTGETASGWQQVNFSSPVAISANTVYVASYFNPTGDFPVTRSYFATTGVNNPPLSASMDGGAGASNGIYAYGSTSQFPTSSYQSSNYWVDVVFSPGGSGGGLGLTLSPKRGGVTVTQQLALTATVTNDVGNAGVSWAVSSGGTLSGTSTTAATFSAATAGVYTVTATSIANPSVSATAAFGVTDLAGVFTYHNDLSRDGSNPSEYALTTASVTATTFGKLFSCTVDGAIYAQPLWVANVTIAGAQHNVVFVATQHDSLYAFDADVNTTPCTPLWHVNLIDAAHGGSSSESTVPSGGTGSLVGQGAAAGGDIQPEVGVTGTPVIDPATKTLYVVSKSVIVSGPTFFQRLHAIDLTTGNEKTGSPVTIAGTYPGTGDGGTTVTFSPRQQNQRPGLALVNGIVYIAWASHEDKTPYYGWVMGYNAATLAQTYVLNITPNVGWGGIWMSGGAPAADASNNLYLISGNAAFNANSTTPPNNDYGDTFLKLSSSLQVSSYFTPSDQSNDNANDMDFGSGGAAILVDQPSSPTPRMVIGGGKDGYLYLLNRDAMGGLGDANAWQRFNFGYPVFATGAFWNNTFYLAGVNGPLQAFGFNTSAGKFNTTNLSQSSGLYGYPGSTPSVSSSGSSNGIVWALYNTQFCTDQSTACGPTQLHVYDATNLATELWKSISNPANSAGNAVKFTVPTVANGKVYVGTRGNNTGGVYGSTSISGELDVYGLLPN